MIDAAPTPIPLETPAPYVTPTPFYLSPRAVARKPASAAEMAALAGLSLADVVETQSALRDPRFSEANPFLGRRPTVAREVLQTALVDYVVLRSSETARRVLIGVEVLNNSRNLYVIWQAR